MMFLHDMLYCGGMYICITCDVMDIADMFGMFVVMPVLNIAVVYRTRLL